MRENEISAVVLDACVRVHRQLGPGLFESVYEAVLARELERRGLRVERQVAIPIVYRGEDLGEAFRADLIVDGLVLIELKAVAALAPVHSRQVLTYLRVARLRLGLLVNFNTTHVKNEFVRIVDGL